MSGIFEIEKKYDVRTIMWNGREVWPFLRIYLYAKHRYKNSNVKLQYGIRNRWVSLIYLLRGFSHLFSHHDYLIFSNSSENKLITSSGESLYKNKLFLTLFQELGEKNILYLEQPLPKHITIRKNGNPNFASTVLLEMLARFVSYLVPSGTLEGREILADIQSELGTKVNIQRRLKELKGFEIVLRILLTIQKPKAVFLTVYYSGFHMALCRVCKAKGIPVVELQHGILNASTVPYNFNYKNTSYDFFPGYYLCFGEAIKQSISGSPFIPIENVLTVGNAYLHSLTTNPAPSSSSAENLGAFGKPIVTVTLQSTNESALVPFMLEVARLNPQLVFLLLSRTVFLTGEKANLMLNLKYYYDLNFYELMPLSGLHMTVYSTCGIEAPALGVQNILVDINGDAVLLYGKLLSDKKSTLFINKPEEFSPAFEALPKLSRAEIAKTVEHIFAKDHPIKLQQALQRIFSCRN